MKGFLVSVIVTTKNEGEVLARLLKSIMRQSYKNIETLVIDNNSSDKTKDIARKYTKLVFDKGPERSAQRNFGALRAKGKYLFFLDADMELSRDVVRDCVIAMTKNRKVGAVVVPELSIANTYWEKVKAFERGFYNLGGDEITDAARFFEKSIFRKLKGYDESLTGPEDWDLTERIKSKGYKIIRVEPIIYHYERIPSLLKLMRKKYYYGLGSYKYLQKQKISAVGPKTIYFLRPAFYRSWKKMINRPLLTFSMGIMLFCELFQVAWVT